MKKSIKCLSAVLMTSVLAVSAGAAAAPTFAGAYDITMSTTSGHSYTAYQVFAGDLHETTSGDPAVTTKTLSNIEWGNGVDSAALLTALQGSSEFGAPNPFIGKTTASKVAEVVNSWADDSDYVKAFAKLAADNIVAANGIEGTTTISTSTAGYYLIKDTTDAGSMPAGNTYSEFMLEVVSNVDVTAKDETVTSDKKVTDKNDSTGVTETGQTTADYDIGDTVDYVLTFTLPEKYDEYVKYPVTFIDEMCAGLTYSGDAKIYYGAASTTGTTISFTPTDITTGDLAGGKRYTATIPDLKAAATLSAGDVVRIEYSAVLNSSAVIGSAGNPNKYSVEFANDPNWDGSGEPTKSTTPPVENKVYTYKLVINKTDGTSALPGADFELYKFINGTGTDTYKVGETTYSGTWTKITELGSGTNKPAKSAVTAATTSFEFSGLDDGHYKLVETVTPPGFNTIDDVEFDISPTENGTLANVTSPIELTANSTAGSLTGSVVNNEGVELPGTGGMGTTIFYIVGGLMVTGALVLLIVRKRMNIKEK